MIQKIILFFVKIICFFLPSHTIKVDGKPYLTRYYILLRDWKSFSLFFHHFHASDQGLQLHNHPWKWALSFIFFGGYLEEFKKSGMDTIGQKIVLPFSFNTVKHEVFHRVDLLNEAGAWSLFFAGPRIITRPEWGFLDRNTFEFQDWRENPEAIP